jgi:hypothetical protein
MMASVITGPVDLAELAPYYSRVEGIFKVTGRKENLPHFPDGNFVPMEERPDTRSIARLTEAAKSKGIAVSKMRSAMGE